MQRITLHYDRPLIRQAVSRFWWRVVGIRFVVAFALLAIGLAMLIRDGDTSWMTGALASILVFGLLFVIAIYLVHYRDGLARLEGMGSPQATLEMTKKSLTLSSGAGSSTLPWSSIEEIWQFEPCWLLLFSRSHFVTLPRADLTPETQAYLLDRVRTSRANAS